MQFGLCALVLEEESQIAMELSISSSECLLEVSQVGQAARITASRDIPAGKVVLELAAAAGVTSTEDAAKHQEIGSLAEGRDELIGLTLWLLAEQHQAEHSSAAEAVLATLPAHTSSPMLWASGERREMLRGSPALEEAEQLESDVRGEWASISSAAESASNPLTGYANEQKFVEAFSVVLAHAHYLTSAQCFALLPLIPLLQRSTDPDAAVLDYDLDRNVVVVTTQRSYRQGEEVRLAFQGTTAQQLVQLGALEPDPFAGSRELTFSLVKSDRMFQGKVQILADMGMQPEETFPVYEDRMPAQLLPYLRLSRIQEADDFAKINMKDDRMVSDINEYEILQLLAGEARTLLGRYAGNAEEDLKKLQNPRMPEQERLATRLLMAEKKALEGTLATARKRLAPIRGLAPVKGGKLKNVNSDLMDIFDTIESIPNKPGELIGEFMSWARGEKDPTWKKRK
ncbi:hypothetical protein WJX84_007057 [Apatococcus fuscideae]|uniref:Rubisco LSMT substrate-binding domain-containing protein n=1 Tax=Apatococcus fuscideae TaxID=2026836 RepID=A0AAW1RM96_9CHLO